MGHYVFNDSSLNKLAERNVWPYFSLFDTVVMKYAEQKAGVHLLGASDRCLLHTVRAEYCLSVLLRYVLRYMCCIINQ